MSRYYERINVLINGKIMHFICENIFILVHILPISIRVDRPVHQNMYHQRKSWPKLMGVQKRHFFKKKMLP